MGDLIGYRIITHSYEELEKVSERLFDDFHIQLPTDVQINFKYCDGKINAFYYPGYYEIDFC